MSAIDAYRPEDAPAINALYRRVFGNDAAEANRLRWDWQYRRNPNNPPAGPLIWIAREGPTIVGQYATMPVRLVAGGHQITGCWGMDVMVAPERQRQGLGELLFRTWDQAVGASLGLGLSPSSSRLFQKLGWPHVGPLPCLVKPLTRRALRRPTWPVAVNRIVSAVTLPFVRFVARQRPLGNQLEPVRRFDDRFTTLWDAVAGKFDFAVRRDAAYLNWRFMDPPHVRYSVVALTRESRVDGYVVYRHAHAPGGRVTLLVDFLADPDDDQGMKTLLRWVDREAQAAYSDTIRAYAMHAGIRRIMKRSGYFQVASSVDFTAKINAVHVPPDYYARTEKWHVTFGDSDQDH